ncbi:MAG: hypothetical protein GY849_20315, partial [Deltaproteobacteria bacterium]|nr:hypothetical protein [Deltaproteobacteria bacterium]
ELPNHPYIHFWHQLDQVLAGVPELGQELLGEQAWEDLFDSGLLDENENIIITVDDEYRLYCHPEVTDQVGGARPANNMTDIGAIEIP